MPLPRPDEPPLLPIAGALLRRRCKVAGIIRSVRIEPGVKVPVFEVVVEDATGRMVGAFWGRRTIPGIRTGERIEMIGTPRLRGAEKVMANPLYTLRRSEPSH